MFDFFPLLALWPNLVVQLHRNNNLVPWLFLLYILPIPATNFYLHTLFLLRMYLLLLPGLVLLLLPFSLPTLLVLSMELPRWFLSGWLLSLLVPLGLSQSHLLLSLPIYPSYLEDLLLLSGDSYFLLLLHDPWIFKFYWLWYFYWLSCNLVWCSNSHHAMCDTKVP